MHFWYNPCMAHIERSPYNPHIHGDPEEFIHGVQSLGLSPQDGKNLELHRRSTVLAAAFTPIVERFTSIVTASEVEHRDSFFDGVFVYSARDTRSTVDHFEIDVSEHLKRFNRYYEMKNLNSPFPLTPQIQVPVGKYGDKFADAIVRSSWALCEHFIDTMDANSLYSVNEYTRALKRDTFTEFPHLAMLEGIQTTAAATALLTGDGVPGYEADPIGGMRSLIDRKIFQQFAALSPSGIVVPMALDGWGFREPLAVNPEGNIVLSQHLKNILKAEKPNKFGHVAGEARLGKGCPVARNHTGVVDADGTQRFIKESGVQLMMKAYLPYLEYYYDRDIESNREHAVT